MKIENLIRENIRDLAPYSSARDEFSGSEGVFLDANENPYGELNRYPDPYQRELKNKIAELKKVDTENLFLGNGSDEVIDIIYRIFAEPQKDEVLIFPPTYGMYEVMANINNVGINKIDLNKNWQIPKWQEIEKQLDTQKLKIIFICSPNNPTGNIMSESRIKTILDSFDGIVVIDEAYIDFADTKSWIHSIHQYKRLIVMQTFSKFWGMAGVRVGMAFAHKEIIHYMNKVKSPYNISILNQREVLKTLNSSIQYEKQLNTLLSEREHLQSELQSIPFVKKVYHSDANFLFIEVENANKIYHSLVKQNIIVRNRHSVVENCLRISIGTPKENRQLIVALKKMK